MLVCLVFSYFPKFPFFACLYEGHMAVCPYSGGTCKGSYSVYSAGMMGTILRLNDAAWNCVVLLLSKYFKVFGV